MSHFTLTHVHSFKLLGCDSVFRSQAACCLFSQIRPLDQLPLLFTCYQVVTIPLIVIFGGNLFILMLLIKRTLVFEFRNGYIECVHKK